MQASGSKISLDQPFVLVNFKTYLSSTGENANKIAKIAEKVASETGVSIGVAVQAVDLRMVAGECNVPVFAQHVDDIEPGSNTGAVLAEAIKRAGAVGTLVNHSEKRIVDKVGSTVSSANRAGLMTIVCAETPDEAEKFIGFAPDYIAIEPPELIGGDISVSTAQPELISSAVERFGGDKVVVGAGIKTGEDVRIARKLGAAGVLVASGVCKAGDPESVLMDFAKNLM